MDLKTGFMQRLTVISSNLAAVKGVSQEAKVEVEYRVERIRSLLSCYWQTSNTHPLGRDPFLAAEILFELDRCECLLEQDVPCLVKEPAAISCLWIAVLRRVIAFLVFVRGRLRGYLACYDSPMLIEILYYSSPAWLLPIIHRLLPMRRRHWQANSSGPEAVLTSKTVGQSRHR